MLVDLLCKSWNEEQNEDTALARRLIHGAGYQLNDGVTPVGGAFQAEFETLLMALAYVRARKADGYGDFRLLDIRSWERETWGAYWDIQRKFGRMDQQFAAFRNYRDVDPKVDEVIETCGDLANYALMMIQVLRRLEQKGLVPK